MTAHDPQFHQPSNSDRENGMTERRGRRLNLSCRLFLLGEENFEEEATILDLSTNGCQATSLAEMQVGMVLHLSLFLQDQEWPVRIEEALVRWVKGEYFGLEFTKMMPAQRERVRALIMKAKP